MNIASNDLVPFQSENGLRKGTVNDLGRWQYNTRNSQSIYTDRSRNVVVDCLGGVPSQLRSRKSFVICPPFTVPATLQPGATSMADEDDIERIPINRLRQEEGAHELATSPDMEPYLDFAMALMQGHDPTPELEAIRQLPVEKRYVWRV